MDQIVTLEEAKQIVKDNYYTIWDNAKDYNRDVKVYLHWTAGNYNTVFDHYHFCITGDGTIHYTCAFDEPVSSTYMRNSGSVSITLCCCGGDDVKCWDNGDGTWGADLGEYPPTYDQIYAMAALVEAVADALDLTIDKDRIMTHGEAADNEDGLPVCEPYAVWSDPQPSDGITRWDLAVLESTPEKENEETIDEYKDRLKSWWRSGGDTIRGNALYIRNHKDEE